MDEDPAVQMGWLQSELVPWLVPRGPYGLEP